MRGRRLCALLVVALAPSAAGRAQAAAEPPTLEAGPAIALGGVAWIERRDGVSSVRWARPGAGAETLLAEGERRPLDVLGSSRLLAVSRSGERSDCPPDAGCSTTVDVLVGVPGRPFSQLVGDREYCGGLAVSGSIVSYLVACRDDKATLRVARVDPATGAQSTLRELLVTGRRCCSARLAVRLAWPFLAAADAERRTLAVYDLRSGRIVNRLGAIAMYESSWFDVGEDGTLAYALQVRGERWWRVAWHAPRSRRPHVLPFEVAADLQGPNIRLARGQIVLRRALRTTTFGRLAAWDLVVSDLRGRVMRTVRRPLLDAPRGVRPDFDGRALAWVAESVTERRVVCRKDTPCRTVEGGAETIRFDAGGRAASVARYRLERLGAQPWEPRRLIGGPVFARGGIAWLESVNGNYALRFWNGRTTSIVAWGVFAPAAGSEEILALANADVLRPPARGITPLSPTACATPDVDGATVAVLECKNGWDADGIAIHDLRGAARRFLPARALSARCCTRPQLAGRFLAWSNWFGNVATVYDRVRGRVVYRIYGGGGVADLAADGTILRETWDALTWASPAEPRPHVIPFRRSRAYVDERREPLLGGRRIVALGDRAGGAELVVLSLDGRRRTLARFGSMSGPRRLVGTFDLEAGRVAWASEKIDRFRRLCGRTGDCSHSETGAFTIWVLEPGARRPRAVVHVPFRER